MRILNFDNHMGRKHWSLVLDFLICGTNSRVDLGSPRTVFVNSSNKRNLFHKRDEQRNYTSRCLLWIMEHFSSRFRTIRWHLSKLAALWLKTPQAQKLNSGESKVVLALIWQNKINLFRMNILYCRPQSLLSMNTGRYIEGKKYQQGKLRNITLVNQLTNSI